jgi:hypothetical protein
MKIHIFLSLILIIIPLSFIYSADELQKYIPKNGEIKYWNRSGLPLLFDSKNLFDLIDGAADVYLEYGFNEAINQEYVKDDTLSIVITIFKMKNSISAFGIFSFTRRSDSDVLNIGGNGYETEYNVSFYKGSFYVVVESFFQDENIKNVRREFAKNIAQKIKENSELPSIFKSIPNVNGVSYSEKYINGIIALNNLFFVSDENVFDIGNCGIGAYKEYSISGRNARLLIFQYNNNIDKIFNSVIEHFNSNYGSSDFLKEYFVNFWRKKDGKFVFLKRTKNFIIVVFDVQENIDGISILNLLNSTI